MDFAFWIPTLVAAGLAVFGLVFAFVAACDYI